MKPSNPSLEMSINCSKDRISDLPNDVMLHILSSGAVKDAVKFCSLSKHWKSLWTSMPNLLFRFEWRHFSDKYLTRLKARKFASFVDRALLLYSAPKVKTFSLNFKSAHELKSRVDSWLLFAVTHEVEELFLIFGERYCSYEIRDEWRWTWPWPSLKVLSLVKLRLAQEDIRSIFCGSPLIECLTLCTCEFTECEGGCFVIDATDIDLKSLTLDDCKIENEFYEVSEELARCVEIKAPDLLSLNVEGEMHFTGIRLGCFPSLKEANVCFHGVQWETMFIRSILQKVRHVNKLVIGALTVQLLTAKRMDGEFCPTFPCKSLTVQKALNDIYLHRIEVLLHGFPFLKKLILDLDNYFYLDREKPAVEDNYCSLKLGALKCLNQNLEKVEIKRFDPRFHRQNLLDVAQFFLDHAKVLQKLTVHAAIYNMYGRYNPRKNALEIKEKLLHHPRASPNAVVVFEISDFWPY